MLSKRVLPLVLAVSANAEHTMPWTLNTFESHDCSGPALTGFNGGDILDSRVDCFDTHFPSTANSIWFQDSATAAHLLRLHEGDVCSDSDEVVSIPEGEGGVCIVLETANGFSLSRAHDLEVRGASAGRPSSELVSRQNAADYYAWSHARRKDIYVHAAGVAGGCAVLNWVTCGFGIAVVVVELAFFGWESWHYEAHRAGTRRSLEAGEPVEYKDMIEGKTVRVKQIDVSHELSRRDMNALLVGRDLDDESHVFLQIDLVDDESGQVESGVTDLDLSTNTTIASAPADMSKFGDVGTGHLARRQEASDYVIHYQSMDMSERARDLFPISSAQAEYLANDIWVWGASENVGGHCAALHADGERLNSGYWSIRTGPFTAHRDCVGA